MRTSAKIELPGDTIYMAAQGYRERAAALLHKAEEMELRAIEYWASLEPKDPSPCSSTDSSASPSA